MKRILSAILVSLLFSLPQFASAEVVVPLVDFQGDDSGWDVVLADNIHSGIVIENVTDSYVLIEISKTFYEPPVGGVFPPNIIQFRQRLDDAGTVPTIRIKDEIIINNTGVDWTDYHWHILGDEAAFDKTATENSGFDVSPFTNMTWGPAQTGWDSDHPASLDVDGGTVPDGGVFFPGLCGGNLFIQVDLTADDSDFSLVQNPTLEPGALTLLIIGGIGVLVRHKRRRSQ